MILCDFTVTHESFKLYLVLIIEGIKSISSLFYFCTFVCVTFILFSNVSSSTLLVPMLNTDLFEICQVKTGNSK